MRVLVLGAVIASAAFSAQSVTDFSFRGVFRCDADVAHVVFTLNDPSRVTRRTYGYGGGKQADGKPVRPGGFDPALVLWDSNGDLLDQWDDGHDPVPQDPDTLFRSDVNASLNLDAGNYRVSLVQWFNGAAGSNLADGFTETSDTFTSVLLSPRGHFCDISEDNRRRTWAFDVLGVDSAKLVGPAVVPLPATLPLLLAALAGVGAVARRRPCPKGRGLSSRQRAGCDALAARL